MKHVKRQVRATAICAIGLAGGAAQAGGLLLYEVGTADVGLIAYETPAREIRYARQRYRENVEKFGREIWVCDDPIEALHADDLPAWTWT